MKKIKIIFALLIINLFCGASGLRAQNTAELPDTLLGKIAAEWLAVVENGKRDEIEKFVETRFSAGARKNQPNAADYFQKLYEQSGGLEIVRVTPAQNEFPMTILARSKKGNHYVQIMAGLDAREGKLAGIGLALAEDPNEAKLNAAAPLTEPQMIAEIKKFVESRAARDLFSGTVLIAKDDRVLLKNSYGLANREAEFKNTPETRFHLASVGKMFTAVAIAQLVKAGKLSYQDTVAKILPDFPNREAFGKITIHQLLTHSSGMGTFFESPGFKGNSYPNSTAEIEVYQDEKLFFEPGARWRYSNAGYSLLGAIIERLSGKTYIEYVRENIFKPLGMRDNAGGETAGKSPLVSVLYRPADNDPLGLEPFRAVGGISDSTGTGFGGGYLSAEDLFKFARAYRAGKLLGAETIEFLATPKVSDTQPGKPNWGYGIVERNLNGQLVRGHSGGGRTDVQMIWNEGYTVIVQTNKTPPPATVLSNEILRFMTKQIALRAEKKSD